MTNILPAALTIAGSDSGGGAGIQADLRAFRDAGIHGCSAITALTAQNPQTVTAVQTADADIVRSQILTVTEGFTIKAVKTGMLANADIIRAVASCIPVLRVPWIVDPVMISTSGHALLDPPAVEDLRTLILPNATLITPNLPETQALLGDATMPLGNDACRDAAIRLHQRYGCAVLVKGGHDPNDPAADWLCDTNGTATRLTAPAVPHPLTTHGTGCTLSAAIAARIALGYPLLNAVTAAKHYLCRLLAAARPAGRDAVYPPNAAFPAEN